jgi:hypothetical protein
VFGAENYVNEIVWKRTSSKSDHAQGAKHWPRIHDVIFFYKKSHDGGPFFPLFADHGLSTSSRSIHTSTKVEGVTVFGI